MKAQEVTLILAFISSCDNPEHEYLAPDVVDDIEKNWNGISDMGKHRIKKTASATYRRGHEQSRYIRRILDLEL